MSLSANSRNGGLKGAERIVRGDVPVAAADDGRAGLLQTGEGKERLLANGDRWERAIARNLSLEPLSVIGMRKPAPSHFTGDADNRQAVKIVSAQSRNRGEGIRAATERE